MQQSCIAFRYILISPLQYFFPQMFISEVKSQEIEIILSKRVHIVWKSLLSLETRARQLNICGCEEERGKKPPEFFSAAAWLRARAWEQAEYCEIQKEIRFWCGSRCLSEGRSVLCHLFPRLHYERTTEALKQSLPIWSTLCTIGLSVFYWT